MVFASGAWAADRKECLAPETSFESRVPARLSREELGVLVRVSIAATKGFVADPVSVRQKIAKQILRSGDEGVRLAEVLEHDSAWYMTFDYHGESLCFICLPSDGLVSGPVPCPVKLKVPALRPPAIATQGTKPQYGPVGPADFHPQSVEIPVEIVRILSRVKISPGKALTGQEQRLSLTWSRLLQMENRLPSLVELSRELSLPVGETLGLLLQTNVKRQTALEAIARVRNEIYNKAIRAQRPWATASDFGAKFAQATLQELGVAQMDLGPVRVVDSLQDSDWKSLSEIHGGPGQTLPGSREVFARDRMALKDLSRYLGIPVERIAKQCQRINRQRWLEGKPEILLGNLQESRALTTGASTEITGKHRMALETAKFLSDQYGIDISGAIVDYLKTCPEGTSAEYEAIAHLGEVMVKIAMDFVEASPRTGPNLLRDFSEDVEIYLTGNADMGAVLQRLGVSSQAGVFTAAGEWVLQSKGKDLFSECVKKVLVEYRDGDEIVLTRMRCDAMRSKVARLLAKQTADPGSLAQNMVQPDISPKESERMLQLLQRWNDWGISYGWLLRGETTAGVRARVLAGEAPAEIRYEDWQMLAHTLQRLQIKEPQDIAAGLWIIIPLLSTMDRLGMDVDRIVGMYPRIAQAGPALLKALADAQVAMIRKGFFRQAQDISGRTASGLADGMDSNLLAYLLHDIAKDPAGAGDAYDFEGFGKIFGDAKALGLADASPGAFVSEVRESGWKRSALGQTLQEALKFASAQGLKPSDIFAKPATMRDVIKKMVYFVTRETLREDMPYTEIRPGDPAYADWRARLDGVISEPWRAIVSQESKGPMFVLVPGMAKSMSVSKLVARAAQQGISTESMTSPAIPMPASVINTAKLAQKLEDPLAHDVSELVRFLTESNIGAQFYARYDKNTMASIGSAVFQALIAHDYEGFMQQTRNYPLLSHREKLERYGIFDEYLDIKFGVSQAPPEVKRLSKELLEAYPVARDILIAMQSRYFPIAVPSRSMLMALAGKAIGQKKELGRYDVPALMNSARELFLMQMGKNFSPRFLEEDIAREGKRYMKFMNACWPEALVYDEVLRFFRKSFESGVAFLDMPFPTIGFLVRPSEGFLAADVKHMPFINEKLQRAYTGDRVEDGVLNLICLFATSVQGEDAVFGLNRLIAYIAAYERYAGISDAKPFQDRFDGIPFFRAHPEFKDAWQVKAAKAFLDWYVENETALRQHWKKDGMDYALVGWTLLQRLWAVLPPADFCLLFDWSPSPRSMFFGLYATIQEIGLPTAKANAQVQPDPAQLKAIQNLFQECIMDPMHDLEMSEDGQKWTVQIVLSRGFPGPLVRDVLNKTVYVNADFFKTAYADDQEKAVDVACARWALYNQICMQSAHEIVDLFQPLSIEHSNDAEPYFVKLAGKAWPVQDLFQGMERRLRQSGVSWTVPHQVLFRWISHQHIEQLEQKIPSRLALPDVRKSKFTERDYRRARTIHEAFAAQTAILFQELLRDRLGLGKLYPLPASPTDALYPAPLSGHLDRLAGAQGESEAFL